MGTDMQNIAQHSKITLIYNKQRLSNTWSWIREKLWNTEAELKKTVAYKQYVYIRKSIDQQTLR